MILSFFSSQGWESWDIERRPLLPERMPVLVDDDLRFEDGPGAPRPVTVVNRWLRELPASGCPAPGSWESYARTVKEWAEFLDGHGIGLFSSRQELKAALGKYAGYRAAGPPERRFAATTWGRHMSVLSLFYRWAMDEGHAQAEPFTYRMAPRNAAVGQLALSTGLRLQEFSYLLTYEIPALPPRPTKTPVPFPVPAGVTKGRKFRVTWISYEALAAVHHYLELDRPATADGTAWLPPRRWGEPLRVTDPDERGGRVNGIRCRWETLTPGERRRLVAPGGGSCVLAVKNGGGPFTAWASVFERTSDRIRARFEPRFPSVHPHRLRHSMAMRTLEYLVSGHYRQAAKLVTSTDADAALVLYLTKADPLLVLRDLLGHASVLTTEKYLRKLDTTRIFRDAYEQAGRDGGLLTDAEAGHEADAEFTGDADGDEL